MRTSLNLVGSVQNLTELRTSPLTVKDTQRQETVTYTPTDRSMKNTHAQGHGLSQQGEPCRELFIPIVHWMLRYPPCVLIHWTAKETSKEVRVAPRRLTLHGGSDGKECTYSAGDWGSSPGSGRSPGEGNRYPFQYSSLENPMNKRGYSLGVLRSWTQWNN